MKIVYITPDDILGPLNSGGPIGCWKNYRLLQEAFGEDNIHLVIISKEKESLNYPKQKNTTIFYSRRSKLDILRNSLNNRLQFPKSIENDVLDHIKTLGCEIVFIDFSMMGTLQERLPKELMQVLFIHVVFGDFVKDQIRVRPYTLLLRHAFLRNESLAVKNADKIITLGKRDALSIRKHYERDCDLLIPATMEDSFDANRLINRIEKTGKLQLLFVGSLFPYNLHGVTWFVKKIMSHVDAELTIVGRDFEKFAKKLNSSNVHVIGSVDDVSKYYYETDVVVMPILIGNGMKLKTTEALMYGKPIIATNEALEGYDVGGLDNVYRCNSKEQFISTINEYANNKPYLQFDKRIRERFLEKYHTPIYVNALKDLLS
ncbi:MAG: glycosyltransferase [Oscillospiraceae bacterium]|jgi:glycosyltransferase involved in cell wall biosynthesis|nr:glycosyltransferase [Oscillospiraceae bacterium]